MKTVLYVADSYPDPDLERSVLADRVRLVFREVPALSALSEADCAEADGLVLYKLPARAVDLARFKKLRVIVRMSVGYDLIDRAAAAERNILLCNVPDYGTTEVADHAIALALALRRGLTLHHDAQRADPPAAWSVIETPLIRRFEGQGFGIVGLGRIGIAAARRAQAFGFDVSFYDPFVTNGLDRALGIRRFRDLPALLQRADILSIHAPLTPETRGLIGERELRQMPAGAIVVNTARGPILDIAALYRCLKDGHLAGAGLDVLPVEPPGQAIPDLLRAYRTRETWLQGRLIVTPHSAFHAPESWEDLRRKGAETMLAALFSSTPQNVVAPNLY